MSDIATPKPGAAKAALLTTGLVLAVVALIAVIGRYQAGKRHELAKTFEDRYAATAKSLPPTKDLARMAVAFKDRIQPFDSMARSVLRTFSGKSTLYGVDATFLFLSLAFDEDAEWKDVPVVAIQHGQNRRLIGMRDADTLASFEQLRASKEFNAEVARVQAKMGSSGQESLTVPEQEVLTIRGRANELENRFAHYFLIAPPAPGQEADETRAHDWHLPKKGDLTGFGSAKAAVVAGAFDDLSDAWRKRDANAAETAAATLIKATRELAPERFPEPARFERELRYNSINPMTSASYLYILASFLMLFGAVFNVRVLRFLALLSLVGGIGLQGWAFVERISLGFGVAITNLYESMIAVALVCALISLVIDIVMKSHWVTIAGGLAAFFTLQVVDIYSVKYDAGIGGTVAVLANNIWVHIHVPIVMASYSAFFIAFLLATIALAWLLVNGLRIENPDLKSLIGVASKSADLGTLLIFVGLILGGVWAHDSWGRFWGWDPKETWALILFLYYCVLAHGRFTKWMRPFWQCWWIFGGGPVLLFTYYGTNELLSGLHSYANSAGDGGFWSNLVHEKNRWFVWSMGVTLGLWAAIGVIGLLMDGARKGGPSAGAAKGGLEPAQESA